MKLASSFLGLGLETWIGLIIGSTVTVVVALFIYWLQRQPKTLDYALISSQSFQSGAVQDTGLVVKIYWKDGQDDVLGDVPSLKLEAPQVFNFRVKNTGKRAISRDDFATPVRIHTQDGSIQAITIRGTSEDGVCDDRSVTLRRGAQVGAVLPDLLNAGDWFDVQVLTDSAKVEPEFSARVRDQTRPMGRSSAVLDPPLLVVASRSAATTVIVQWIVGAASGALMWVTFRFLWSSFPVVAAGGAVLVTIGLIAAVRVLLHNIERRTSMLALAVGLLLSGSPAILVALGW